MSQVQMVDREQAKSRRVISEGKIRKVVDYFGGAAAAGGAQAYLVEQKNYVTRAHFHPTDQFQILLGAEGSLFGRRPVSALEVHYADAYTVYGPLVGGDPPLRYFTLRATPTDVTEYMPEARERRRERGGRSLSRRLEPTARVALGQAVYSPLLDDDGHLGIAEINAGADATVSVPASGPVGQFVFVVEGTLRWRDGSYGPESVGWQPAGEPGFTGTAGPAGARLLTLRFRDRAGAETPDDGRDGPSAGLAEGRADD
ncbi:hypothetical protein [Micromonospora tarensis]|uniref:Cupin domain-containing protein n=1 Tax=Micromonospora tarensis TaxID=2806100 RepID=A0ABS1YA74_9ACTN|nr:hypothetical protein [Micromonospora tarensis]MBM0274298.1 hypothetical protein [Micromonospora tarensis]